MWAGQAEKHAYTTANLCTVRYMQMGPRSMRGNLVGAQAALPVS